MSYTERKKSLELLAWIVAFLVVGQVIIPAIGLAFNNSTVHVDCTQQNCEFVEKTDR